MVSLTRTTLDGYRDWARQGRTRANAHLGYVLSPSTDLRGFYFFARVSEQLPGALSADELRSSPTAANAENLDGHWGRNYDLHHLGLQLRSQLGLDVEQDLLSWIGDVAFFVRGVSKDSVEGGAVISVTDSAAASSSGCFSSSGPGRSW